jgi:predicted nucleic acid-binding protein
VGYEFLDQVALTLCAVFPGTDFYHNSVKIMERTGYSFYYAMIIKVARYGDCRILYSEDLRHGFKLFDATVENPLK